jgi:hypothetical protein
MAYQFPSLIISNASNPASAMSEGIASPNPATMEQNLETQVDEKASLSVPSGAQPCLENELLRKCKDVPGDDAAAIRELAIAASVRMQKIACSPAHKYHRKTGRIRTPRDNSGSGERSPKQASLSANPGIESTSSDDDAEGDEGRVLQDQDRLPTPEYPQKQSPSSTAYSPPPSTTPLSNAASPPTNTRWTRVSKGKYAVNPIKCPPCARRKKADKCRGGPPCWECWSRGRKTAALCQEWGEGWEDEK